MSGFGPSVVVVEATQQRADTRFTKMLEPLTQRVVDALAAAGMRPRRLAIGDVSEAEVAAAYAASDAVVVMGGEDVTPGLYGAGEDYPESGVHLQLADERTCALIVRAGADAKPLFGICRGLQLVNVACGGDLVQHLPTSDDHRNLPPNDADFVRHSVRVAPGTRLAAEFGEVIDLVDSSHHQAVGRLAAGFRVTARAFDGTIEAIEHETAPIFAVQWHPESATSEPSQLPRLLRMLVRAATNLPNPE